MLENAKLDIIILYCLDPPVAYFSKGAIYYAINLRVVEIVNIPQLDG